MLDVLHGFIALYFVDVVGTSGGGATVAILVWTSLGLVGDALAIPLLERVGGLRYVRASAGLMLVVFPAFLLVGPVSAKLALLGVEHHGQSPDREGQGSRCLEGSVHGAGEQGEGRVPGVAGAERADHAGRAARLTCTCRRPPGRRHFRIMEEP
jgi:hypothetical protein